LLKRPLTGSEGPYLCLSIRKHIARGSVVTFALNFWKGERDFRRIKLEELYAAAHKYILAIREVSSMSALGQPSSKQLEDQATENFGRVALLVSLYFPQLAGPFERFRERSTDLFFRKGYFFVDSTETKKKIGELSDLGEKFKQAIIECGRDFQFLD
jgi:hypothetical protein